MFTLSVDALPAGAARLRLLGHLDATAARDLLHTAADVARSGCSRLVVDLADLASYAEDAVYALTGCARLGRWLPDGVQVVAGSEAGAVLAERAGVAAHLVHAAAGHLPGTMVACPAC